MNWAIYGWFMLVVAMTRLFFYKRPDRVWSQDARLALALMYLFLYLPLIGHLIGWW